MTNGTSLESSYALLLESAKKIANLQKIIFNPSYLVKIFANKKSPKNKKNIHF